MRTTSGGQLPTHPEDVMPTAVPKVARVIVLALAAGLAACSDASTPVAPLAPHQPRHLVSGGTETLATGLNLTNGSSATWNVSMPSSGTIRLSFDARIDYPSTAGNSTIFDVKVNGVKVTSAQLYNKGANYIFPDWHVEWSNVYHKESSSDPAGHWYYKAPVTDLAAVLSDHQ